LGETPHSFITTYRMNKALEMLRSGKTVSEVCYSVGASAIQNFSRTFKAKFGVPPTQFEQIS
jgi:AraC-like DNA-binding protein